MAIINGYRVIDTLVDTAQFSLMRVEENSEHGQFIAKSYPGPSDKEIQSLKNIVQLVRDNEWADALEPIHLLVQKDAMAIIFKDYPGLTLRQLINDTKKIKPSAFVAIAIGIARMLASFHSDGWIIGNLKPEHLFIDPANAGCKLADFRKASRLLKKGTVGVLALTGPGDLDYISPEQTGRVNQVVDTRADLYSLGIIFYEMLTGRLPFKANSNAELIYAQIAKQPVALNIIDPYLPQVLSDIVLKLLDKNPEQRYQSAQGLIHDLENAVRLFQDDIYLSGFKLGQKDFVSRITITTRLMGRDEELAILNDAYRLAQVGKKQALYIAGYSGIGKTRLVEEFQRKSVEPSSFITRAKFDALQRNTPYSALINAIRDLIRILLREEDDRLAYWKQRLLSYLNGNGQIIINVVPELEIVIGKQPPPSVLSPDESQNRFQQTFLNFIEAFSSDNHTLIIFLDDMQWADLASIKLIELTILENRIRKFLFVGAYRDHEVDPTHPLAISLNRQKQLADIKQITLFPLAKTTIADFILETLQRSVERPEILVEKIYRKTQGNIFFTIQLISSLSDAGLLYKDEAGLWRWSEKALQDYNLAQNVVELLVEKINCLQELQRKILCTAACIGDSFDLHTTANLTGQRLYTIANELSDVINMGYLFSIDENLEYYIRSSETISDADLDRADNVRFQFAHDRIRQACLSIVSEEEIALTNLQAGKFKLGNYSEAAIEQELFLIANHFNNGRQFAVDAEDIASLVDINIRAGKKARDATAYESAIGYFNQGKVSLSFEKQYRQLYDCCLLGAACKYQTGQYTEAEMDLEELYSHTENRLDKLEVLMLKVHMYTSRDEKEKAVETGRIGFALYGLYMPKSKRVVMLAVMRDIIKAKWATRGRRVDLLPSRPLMQEWERIRLMEFTLAVSPPIYQYDQNLFAWDVMQMVTYSLKHGNNGIASFGYMGFGMILSQTFNDYRTGKKLADIAIMINRQLGYTVLKWKLGMSFHNFVQHWTRPVRPEFENMLEIINGCIANGDPIYAGYGIFHYHQKRFALGFPLEELQQSFENYFRLVDQRADRETRHFLEGYYHAIRCLRGEEDNVLLFGETFNVPERLNEIVASSSYSIAADTYIAYMNLLYQFGLDGPAWQRYHEGGKFMAFIYHRYEYAEYNFYGGLICARAHEKKLSTGKQALKMLHVHLAKLKRWCGYCPDNFEPQCLLLQAELARISGQGTEAGLLYEKAIQSAGKYLYVNIKALANELAGRHYFQSGNATVARTYLDNAREAYLQWGANLKVDHLENEFAAILAVGTRVRTTVTSSNISLQNIDMGMILEASHAVNSATDIDKVIEQLMQTVIKHSGADTGFLLIRNRADLVTKARYNSIEGVKTVAEYADADMLPLSTIRYVARLKEPLVFDNPALHSEYSSMPYFLNHHPLSVLIFPILKQGELFGILYLENYLSAGIFDTDRIGILNLVSAQMAMLLDNAYLYKNMESMVKERTVALEIEKEQMSELLKNIFPKEAIEELKTTGKATPQRLENVTVLLADIKGFTNITEQLSPEELIEMIDSYFRAFDEIMGQYGLEKIKTIGDAYMAIGGIGKTLNDGDEKMLRAALDMQAFAGIHKHRLPLAADVELRIGIHTGVVIAGVVGTKKLQYDIWGDTVNIAARMEQSSEAGRVNVSATTYERLKDKFNFTYRGKVKAKNKGEMDMYFVDGVLTSRL